MLLFFTVDRSGKHARLKFLTSCDIVTAGVCSVELGDMRTCPPAHLTPRAPASRKPSFLKTALRAAPPFSWGEGARPEGCSFQRDPHR